MMRAVMRGAIRVLAPGALALIVTFAPASAQQVGTGQQPRTLRVAGIGEVQTMPDEARVMMAVESFAATARGAGQDNAQRMEQVIQALVSAGVPRADIQTLNYAIHPEYEHVRPLPGMEAEQPRIRGYRATNQVVVQTRRLDQVGSLIDVALGAGANRFDGVGFQLRDSEAAQAEALRRAVVRAQSAAETMAAALGVPLGPVVDASTQLDLVRPYPMMEMAAVRSMDMAAAPTPIQPGEQTVRAQVSVVYSIGQQ
jgi:uncharacterized protein